MITVAKFGGTSLANATQIKKVLAIIKADSSRKYIVVSAPGKQDKDDIKVTDMLIEWYRLHVLQKPTDDIFKKIKARFLEICYDLALDTEINLRAEFDVIEQQMKSGVSPGYISSRGEYLMAKILAAALKFKFVDATNLISFDRKGSYIPVEDDLEHLRHLHNKLQDQRMISSPSLEGVRTSLAPSLLVL
jgi:aspartate kinase